MLHSRIRLVGLLLLIQIGYAQAQSPSLRKSGQARLSSSASPIQAGPMVGYAEMREVMLWVQTKQPGRVQIRYVEQGKAAPVMLTAEVATTAATVNTAHLVADEVLPGKRYSYEVLVNGKEVKLPYATTFQTQPLWQFRSDPPNFTFAVGSCTYVNEPPYDRPGTPYGAGYGIFTSMTAKKPDFMIWTGDNTYTREVDWNSRTGVMKRYTHTRSLPEMQPLLASTHNYAIWDDHDYGPNDSDRSYWMKPVTLEAFKLVWANPNFIFDEGCTGTFVWSDCQFFLLDDRTFRAPNEQPNGAATGQEKAYFGTRQLDWFIDALRFSKATFKFVVTGGQVINPTDAFENYAAYSAERAQFLTRLADAKIPGVLFITGDRHHSIIHKLDRPGTYPLYDVTISPLTSGPAKPTAAELAQPTVVEGTLLTERNFATMEVSGPLNSRLLTIRAFDVDGKEKWVRTLKSSELR